MPSIAQYASEEWRFRRSISWCRSYFVDNCRTWFVIRRSLSISVTMFILDQMLIASTHDK